MNNIYLIIGESGTGKTSICDILEKEYGLRQLQSYTTRRRRSPTETGHIFITEEIFFKLEDRVATKKFDKNWYCSTIDQVQNSDLYVIDPNTVEQFKVNYRLMDGAKGVKVIYITSKLTYRYERMIERVNLPRLEASEMALNRIVHDVGEFTKASQIADITIQNDDQYKSIGELADVVWEYIKSEEEKAVLKNVD